MADGHLGYSTPDRFAGTASAASNLGVSRFNECLPLYRALETAGVAAEPWVMSEEEFEETKSVIGGLAYPAWKEGVVLYENA